MMHITVLGIPTQANLKYPICGRPIWVSAVCPITWGVEPDMVMPPLITATKATGIRTFFRVIFPLDLEATAAIMGIINATIAELLINRSTVDSTTISMTINDFSLFANLVCRIASPNFAATPVSNNAFPIIIIPATIMTTFVPNPEYASSTGITPKRTIASDASKAVATSGILSKAKDTIASKMIIIAIVLCSINDLV